MIKWSVSLIIFNHKFIGQHRAAILGMKMMHPAMAAARAVNSTPPAARSFISPALLSNPGEM